MRETVLTDKNVSLSEFDGDPTKQAWLNVVVHSREPEYPIRPFILNSWIRCREAGIDPFAKSPPQIMSEEELKILLKLNKELVEVARPIMQMIEISVKGTGFLLSLADNKVRVLETIADSEILEQANKNNYVPGCHRNAMVSGTNAIALALEQRSSVQLTGAEHYNINYHNWTCSSAPIHDGKDNIIGVLTLSGKYTGKHKHTLALVDAAVHLIETQIREHALIDESQRLNTMVNMVYNSLSDGFLAINRNLEITHLNATAAKMLGINEPRQIFGRRIEEISLMDEIQLQKYADQKDSDHIEIKFRCQGGDRSYLCRITPTVTGGKKFVGMIITMSEKNQMINIVRQLSGNHSKYEFNDIIGNNSELHQQIKLAKLAATTDSRVLLVGESGTGKELFAQAIHSHSNRSNQPFVAISCGSIPRDLIESELFGYVEGAFTGARRKGMVGKFELANNGTLFLDEINSLPLELQTTLLRVLQQNEIMRIGDNRTIPINVRIIAASNTNLLQETANGNFRADLYYRLNVVEIVIPPLCNRLDDLEMLLEHIICKQCSKLGMSKPDFSSEALNLLRNHNWPGNIRELENICERALLLSQGKRIEAAHLPIQQNLSPEGKIAHPTTMQQNYRELIISTLQRCDGNAAKTARELKIGRTTLYRKMAEYGIER
ncbi:sigma-54-dependent Fis family transcriptional regulator [Desulforhopalus singaporensis]|uniref:Transcriptional regulator of acetoin/glycerol metabolism n=1 Tax=Desulforhopalus singaporensis TaxID=91360 RepID=A0A1H0VNG2_9BACT|nr:sigma 54-interacting transcriptional regulator [Desulforhopalus singaporensis]SDP79801.1 Transcriptional regulator of acetoin/glycerol metabolism [Desulforhopalus singaporensis]